jgi:hypothetical protein
LSYVYTNHQPTLPGCMTICPTESSQLIWSVSRPDPADFDLVTGKWPDSGDLISNHIGMTLLKHNAVMKVTH